MGKRIFTEEQRGELGKNVNVARCSVKSITYSTDFKVEAVRRYAEGQGAREIFRQAGFDLETIGKKQPKECLRRWNGIFREKGKEGLSEKRGASGLQGRKQTKNISAADKIKRLEAEVAYLKAENDFLAKLRAKRRE